jgi:hypothetical protein
MHLYFQSVHEEHQMGLRLTFIQFVKKCNTLFLHVARLLNLHEQETLTPLHHKKDLLENLLKAKYSHQLATIMEDIISHHNFKSSMQDLPPI